MRAICTTLMNANENEKNVQKIKLFFGSENQTLFLVQKTKLFFFWSEKQALFLFS
jgi:hypothetical protein